jgi:Uma2 family endonuclease
MADTQVATELLTIEEYLRLAADEPFEIIDGERIILTPAVAGRQAVSRSLYDKLRDHVKANELGEVFYEMTFILTAQRRWVKGSRVPDLCFIRADRWQDYVASNPDWREKPLVIVPDLVVEIISPEDTYGKLNRKVAVYLKDGVRTVWVIDPAPRTVTVYASDGTKTLLSTSDILTGRDVIPGFEIAVSALFA